MTAAAFCQWLADMKAAGVAKTQIEAAAHLGVSVQALSGWKRHGVPQDAAKRTALACAALLAGLVPVG